LVQCFLPCFPTNLCLKYKTILILMRLTSLMYFLMPLVSFDIVCKAFNLLLAPIAWKENFMLNLVPLVFLMCIFDTHVQLFVVLLSFPIQTFIFLLFVIFHDPWCCLNVLLLLKNLGHLWTKTPHQIEFPLKKSRFFVHLLSLWDVLLGSWPNNNHSNLKAQKTLEMLNELNLH
jgi:hypothetical protein